MSWLPAIVIALLTGAVGTVLAFNGADVATQAHRVSDFEGGRGYAVVFLFAPLGFVVSFVIGLLVARIGPARGWAALLTRLSIAIVAAALLIGATTWVSVLAVDRPPTIDGRTLTLEFEIRLPAGVEAPAEDTGFRVSLYASESDNALADVKWAQVATRDGRVVVPGAAKLNSASATRSLLAGRWPSQVFDLALPASPGAAHEAWSEWRRADKRADLTALGAAEAYEVRYRVVRDQP